MSNSCVLTKWQIHMYYVLPTLVEILHDHGESVELWTDIDNRFGTTRITCMTIVQISNVALEHRYASITDTILQLVLTDKI